MWGTSLKIKTAPGPDRFIPTHVGNIKYVCRVKGVLPVHPHACGEHSEQKVDARFLGGSSPRMWGTCRCRSRLLRGPRFIPTHVGNMSCPQKSRMGSSVHPHACGEHFASTQPFFRTVGSSPRMWGTLTDLTQSGCIGRFIPTHVGNI